MQGKLRLHKRHFAQSVSGLAIALVLSAAGGAEAMTLQEAVEYTVTTNPEIDEARANREAIDFELEQARGLYLPQVDIEASAGPGWNDGNGNGENDKDWMFRRGASIVARQMTLDGFAATSEIGRAGCREK